MKYRPEVDGLRAVAVVPVILFHAGFEFFSGGYVGVDVFFVISGYLITTIILAEMNEGRFSLVNFYERRARRILPALMFVILVCLPFAWMWLTPGDMEYFARSIAAVAVFSSNILFWQESGYFDAAAELKPLLHTWSLAVEEQFYVLFPLLLMATWRFGWQKIIAIMAGIFILSLGLAEWAVQNKPWAAFFLLPTRAWELLLGAFCAFFLMRYSTEKFRTVGNLMSFAGIALIAAAVFMFEKSTPVPGVYALIPTVGTALIILFANKGTLAHSLLSLKAFVGIGLVSYSAYLWHQPLFAFARHRLLHEPSEALMLGLSLAALLLAYVTWRLIEQPFRNKIKFKRKQIFTFAAIGSAAMIGLGTFGHVSKGIPDRFEQALAGDVGYQTFFDHLEDQYFDCTPKVIADSAMNWGGQLRCKQSREGKPDVVLLGDSHAEHLIIGLAEAMPDSNVVTYIYGAEPYLDTPEFEFIFEELLNNGEQQLVFISMFYWERLQQNPEDLYSKFKETIEALEAAGKRVVLLGDIPQYTIQPDVCVHQIKGTYGTIHPLCHMPIDQANVQREIYHPALQRLGQDLGIPYIDLYPSLCSAEQCSMVQGEFVIYRDDDHVNIPGSRIVGKYVVEQLEAQ